MLAHNITFMNISFNASGLQCDYSNQATWKNVNQSERYLRTKNDDLFLKVSFHLGGLVREQLKAAQFLENEHFSFFY